MVKKERKEKEKKNGQEVEEEVDGSRVNENKK